MWRGVLAPAVLLLSVPHDAGACSCLGPSGARLIAPLRAHDAPLNTHVRVALPSGGFAPPEGAGVFEVRSSRGTAVPTTTMTIRVQDAWEDVIDITPTSALQARETYVVVWLPVGRWPDTFVLGTFETGTTTDHEAPVLAPLGAPEVPQRRPTVHSSCDTGLPWAKWDTDVHDPGRARAQLAYAVWLGDAKGNVDTTRAPTALLEGGSELSLGRRSSCSRESFPFPAASFAWVAVAVVDEAGNRSAVQKMRIPVVRPQ